MTQSEFDQIRNRVMEMLTDLAGSSTEFCDFLAQPCEENWDEARHSLCIWTDDNTVDCQFYSGATKAVIVNDEFDYVIKFPFLQDTSYSNWNSEQKKYDVVKTEELIDYCKIEWRNYALAREQGLDDCFAATYYLGDFNGCPIYIQERWDCDESLTSSKMYDSAWRHYCKVKGLTGEEDNFNEIEDKFSDNFYDSESEVQSCDLTYEMWGSEIADKFWQFCESNAINDLHSGNFSCSECHLIVVDMSGYGSTTESAFKDDEWCKNILIG